MLRLNLRVKLNLGWAGLLGWDAGMGCWADLLGWAVELVCCVIVFGIAFIEFPSKPPVETKPEV